MNALALPRAGAARPHAHATVAAAAALALALAGCGGKFASLDASASAVLTQLRADASSAISWVKTAVATDVPKICQTATQMDATFHSTVAPKLSTKDIANEALAMQGVDVLCTNPSLDVPTLIAKAGALFTLISTAAAKAAKSAS